MPRLFDFAPASRSRRQPAWAALALLAMGGPAFAQSAAALNTRALVATCAAKDFVDFGLLEGHCLVCGTDKSGDLRRVAHY